MGGRLILVRHAESEGNATRTFTSSPEVPLTEHGREQARRTGALLRERFRPVRLVSSPYRRALQTAELIGERIGLRIEIEGAVREQHFGELAGRPYEASADTPGFGELPRWEWRPPGGETLTEVRARAAPVLARLAREHVGEEIVVVTHGGTILALWAHLIDSWEEARSVGNADVCLVPHDGRRLGAPTVMDGTD